MSGNNIHNNRFSIFPNGLSKQPSGSVTISGYFDLVSSRDSSDSSILSSARFYHSIGDFDTYKSLKSKVRSFTPHLYFGFDIIKRSIEHASSNSGYVFVELDVKPNDPDNPSSNPHLVSKTNNDQFKKTISLDPYVMGVHDSASVLGKVLVFRKENYIDIISGNSANNNLAKDEHEAYVREIGIYLYENYGVVIDPNCVGINQPRYYSYDDNCYFNPNAETWKIKSKYIVDSLKSNKHDLKGKSRDACKKLKLRYGETVGKTGFIGSLKYEIDNNINNLIAQIKIHFRKYNYYQISSGERLYDGLLSESNIATLITSMIRHQGRNHSHLKDWSGDKVMPFELNHFIKFLDTYFYGQYIIDIHSYNFKVVETCVIKRRDIKISNYLDSDHISNILSNNHISYIDAEAGIGKTTAFLNMKDKHKILSVPRELIITAKKKDLKKHKFGFHYGGIKATNSTNNVVCCHNGLIMAVKNFKNNFPDVEYVICVDEAQLLCDTFGVRKNMLIIQFLIDIIKSDRYVKVMLMSGTPSDEINMFGDIKMVVQKFILTSTKKTNIEYKISSISHNRSNEDMSGDLVKKFREINNYQKSKGITSHNFIYANINEETAIAIANILGYRKHVILRTNNNGSESVLKFINRKEFDDSLIFMNSSITTGVDFHHKQTAEVINVFMINQHFDSNTTIQHLIQAPSRFRSHKNVLVYSLHNTSVSPITNDEDDQDDVHTFTSDYLDTKVDMLLVSSRLKDVLTPLDIKSKIEKFGFKAYVCGDESGVINKDLKIIRDKLYKNSLHEKLNMRKMILKSCDNDIRKLVDIFPRITDLKNYDDDQSMESLHRELSFDMYELFFSDPNKKISLGHKYYRELKLIIKDYKNFLLEYPESKYEDYERNIKI